MSSRVQKGNTVFRPVVKSRARTVAPSASRQASTVPEQLRTDPSSSQISSVPLVSAPSQNTSAVQELDGLKELQQATPSLPDAGLGNTASIDRLASIPESPPYSLFSKPPAVVPSIIAAAPRSGPSVPIIVGARLHRTVNSEANHTPSFLPNRNAAANVLPLAPTPIQDAELQQSTSSSQVLGVLITNGSELIDASSSSALSSGVSIRAPSALTDSNSMGVLYTSQVQSEEGVKTVRRKKRQDDGPKKLKRRRKGSTDTDDVENVQDRASSKQPRSRASSSTPRPRKHAPSPTPYDPDADPGEDIDPTTMTMADLCSDTGQGRVSRKAAEVLSNHAAWKVSNREKRTRMKAIMEAKKYGREEEGNEQNQEATTQNETASTLPADTTGPSTSSNAAAVLDDTGSGFDYSQHLVTSRYNVQVRIGPNGVTVIDEESLVVDRVENDGTDDYTHVIESDHTKFVNSGTYGKRFRGSRWSAEETELFYDALSQYGENYELIAYVLPGRDRKSCKNKFKAEDKKNHARINHCLNNSIPVDMKTLSRMTGKDFSGPVPEIRAPPPVQPIAPIEPDEEGTTAQNEGPSQPIKKRSRSKSQGFSESGVVVIGDAESFQS